MFAQQQILSLLIQNPSDLSDQLCQGKNDSDLDNSLTQTMQQLLDPSQPNTKHTSNNEIKYQDIDKDIQTIIHTTQQSSDTAINSIQQTIHDNTYDPSQYIKNLFNQFFGNINDFISP